MGSFNIFKKNKKVSEFAKHAAKTKERLEKTTSKQSKKKLEKVKFNIPKEIRKNMDDAEYYFNYYYSKLDSIKSVFKSSETKNKYISNMNALFLLYENLFEYFGKGSLKEKKIDEKYKKFKKTIDTYAKKNKISSGNYTPSDECNCLLIEGNNLKNNYINIFKNESNELDKLKNFGCLIDNMIKPFDEDYYNAGNEIETLKKGTLDVGNVYFAEFQGYIDGFEKCRDYIDDSNKKFSNLISKIDFTFLSKRNSSKLLDVNAMINQINNKFEMLYSKVDGYYYKILDTMLKSEKFNKENIERISTLTQSKNFYINARNSFSGMLLQEFKINKFKKAMESLKNNGNNLKMIAADGNKKAPKVLESVRQMLPETMPQFKSTADDLILKTNGILQSVNKEIAQIKHDGSPMRKVEKVIGTLQKIGNAMEVCNKIVKNAVPVLGKVIG